jgi:hypothetical protein
VVASADGTARLLWQSQSGFTEADGVRAGIVLLAEARGGWRAVGWAFEAVSYGAPSLVERDGGWLLTVPGRAGGSGSRNADLLYRLDRGAWREVELEGWKSELAARLPRGLGVWQGVAYDFEGLTARTPLWRDDDANCCPTGGRARLALRIEGDRLVLGEVALDATARAAAGTAPASCPAERASYRLNAEAAFPAELRWEGPGAGRASDLLLRVRSDVTGRDYWFRFASSQGYAGLTLLPVEAPGPSAREDGIRDLEVEEAALPLLRVFPMREDLAVLHDAARSGAPAPRHLFAPGLGQAFHYGELPQQAAAPGGSEAMPRAVWTLDACR